MSNDEIFFLCVLTGAKEILGIENPVEGFSEEETRAKWEEVSKNLYEKQILYKNRDGEICISDDYAKMSAAISFPDVAFEFQSDDGKVNYIYIRGSIYVKLIRGEDCDLKLYDNREEFIDLLNQEFMFSYCEEVDIDIELSEYEMNKAIELYWL